MIKLRDYQLDAVRKLEVGNILCGGVGSGKSLTALMWYWCWNGGDPGDHKLPTKKPRDLYIITTARKRDTLEWEGELAHFRLSTKPEINGYSNNVVVDSWNNIAKYENVTDSCFIFDEQRVVGKGAWVKSFLKITKPKQDNPWILLSATPGDTWADYIPVFVANGFYKNRTEFVNEHVIYARYCKFPKIDKYVGTKRLVRLRDKILVDMDFDRKTVHHNFDILCNYDKDFYKRVQKERWNYWDDEPMQNAGELCYCLRRITNEDPDRSVKLLEILENIDKAIIFYSFDYELDILRGLGYRPGTEIAEWNGHKHQEIPESKQWVYLVQYTAGAEGWNCIKTDTVIFFSQQYSYKVLEQARGRIDRLNTPYTDLNYYYLKSKAPIDIAIARALANKKKFNEGKFVGAW